MDEIKSFEERDEYSPLFPVQIRGHKESTWVSIDDAISLIGAGLLMGFDIEMSGVVYSNKDGYIKKVNQIIETTSTLTH